MTKLGKRIGLVICAASAALALSACATGGGGYYAGGYGPDGFDTYYDGFYGPIDDGYWGPDAAFYYRGADGGYVRDGGNHFRHSAFTGAHGMHSHPAPAANRAH